MTVTHVPPPSTSPLATLADATLLDRRVDLCRGDDATIDDVRSLLAVTGRQMALGEVDAIRATAILHVAVEALGRFDEHTRCAPPTALKDAVAEFGDPCAADDCDGLVFPWEADGTFDSDECRRRTA